MWTRGCVVVSDFRNIVAGSAVAESAHMEATSPARSILRRLGILLLVFFGLHVASIAIDLAVGASHGFTVDILTLVVGILLVTGSLGAARFLGFVTAFHLVAIIGLVVDAAIVLAAFVPRDLLAEMWSANELRQSIWSAGAVVVEIAFSLYILRALRDPAIDDALAHARKPPMRGPIRWGAGVAAILCVLFLALAATFAPMLADSAHAVAE
jgi:hypothetical protein